MKTTEEMIEVMQAYVNGKAIQCKLGGGEKWIYTTLPLWDWVGNDYRIKPEEKKPEYRPYYNVDEMINDFHKRNGGKASLIWLKFKEDGDIYLITSYSKQDVCVGTSIGWHNLESLLADFTYLDGTPCGKLVE